MEFLFNRVADLKAYLKKIPAHAFSCEFQEIFKNTFFTDDLRAAAFATFWALVKIQVTENFQYNDTHFILQKQSPEVFCEKGVLRNFAKFTGKHLFFPVNFAKFLRTHFLTGHLWVILSKSDHCHGLTRNVKMQNFIKQSLIIFR